MENQGCRRSSLRFRAGETAKLLGSIPSLFTYICEAILGADLVYHYQAAWERYVSTAARQTDAEAKRVELDLHVYFLTREQKNEGEGTKAAKDQCVDALRKFLDGPGAFRYPSAAGAR